MAKKDISTNQTEVFLIKNKSKTILSKDQITFNTLSKKIETLRKQLQKIETESEYKLDIYHKTLPLVEIENIESKSKFVKFIFKLTQVEKLNKKQKTEIEKCIAHFMGDIAKEQDIDDELKAIYNFYNNTSYDEELQEDISDAKSMLEEQLKDELGIEIDLSAFDFADTSPENYAKMQNMIQEAIHEKYGENGLNDRDFEKNNYKNQSKPKNKTKAELKREELQKQKDELKNKSIRSIYLALAKTLHPDLETDIDLKLEKEELMKKVTIAYDNKDLTTLLQLEMQWIYKEQNAALSAEKLRVYIEVLREQVNELEVQKYSFYHHPRFQPIFDYSRYTKKQFEEEMLLQSELVKEETELINDSIFVQEDFKIHKNHLFKTLEYLNDKMQFENQFYDVFGY